jgi:pimeloyl-ACP methyl ester carboxylesterase
MRHDIRKRLMAWLLLITGCGSLVTQACTPPPEPETTVEAGIVDSADGIPISYRVRGEGKPAVVFVHGWTAHQGNWEYQVKHFAESHTVVTLDLGGHGESGRGRASWIVPAFGEDVAAVVTELDLDEVVLVGHSLGGPVVVAAAALIPERIIGVVGVDTLKNAENVY